jgi:hypothetical protein
METGKCECERDLQNAAGLRAMDITDNQLMQIVEAARAEALAAVKARLKEMMVAGMLERVATLGISPRRQDSAAQTPADSPPAESAPAPERPPALGATQPDLGADDALRQEIEAIRRQIAENESHLAQLRGGPAAIPGQPAPAEQTTRADEAGYGYYVYGVVRAGGDAPLSAAGIDPTEAVYLLPCQSLQAVVSRVHLSEFGQEVLQARLQDLAWVEQKVLAHQHVLDLVLGVRELIPMRFCSIYRSEAGILDVITGRAQEFTDALESLKGRQEWSVKVYRDDEIVTRNVAQVSERARDARAKLAGKSDGAAYFLKKKIEEIEHEEAERYVDAVAQECHDRLTAQAAASHVGPLQSRDVTKRAEEMALNGAYLIAEERRSCFDAELANLQERFGPLGFSFEMLGPWPPYNFVTIGSMEEPAHGGTDG